MFADALDDDDDEIEDADGLCEGGDDDDDDRDDGNDQACDEDDEAAIDDEHADIGIFGFEADQDGAGGFILDEVEVGNGVVVDGDAPNGENGEANEGIVDFGFFRRSLVEFNRGHGVDAEFETGEEFEAAMNVGVRTFSRGIGVFEFDGNTFNVAITVERGAGGGGTGSDTELEEDDEDKDGAEFVVNNDDVGDVEQLEERDEDDEEADKHEGFTCLRGGGGGGGGKFRRAPEAESFCGVAEEFKLEVL